MGKSCRSIGHIDLDGGIGREDYAAHALSNERL